MRESKFTGELLKALRAMMPDAVVLKHTDLFTGGIPDFSVTIDRKTTWFEVKMNNNVPTELQEAVLLRLHRAYVITYDEFRHCGAIEWINKHGKAMLFVRGTKQELLQEIIKLCKEA